MLPKGNRGYKVNQLIEARFNSERG